MKTALFFIVAIVILCTSCSEYSCPTYGNHYTYSPTKQKAFKMKSTARKKKSSGKAEQD